MQSGVNGKADKIHQVDWAGVIVPLLLPLLGMVLALLIGAVMLIILHVNPILAYAEMVKGAFGSVSGITQTLVKATPLLLVGLGICIAFRASVINIGGEGQIIVGAIAATWWPLTFRTWPGWLLIPSTLLVGFAAGALWGFIPGILKARLKVNEILSTVMMNAIALQLMNLLVRSVLMDPAGITAGDLPGTVGTAAGTGLADPAGTANAAAQRLFDCCRVGGAGVCFSVANNDWLPHSCGGIQPGCSSFCRD